MERKIYYAYIEFRDESTIDYGHYYYGRTYNSGGEFNLNTIISDAIDGKSTLDSGRYTLYKSEGDLSVLKSYLSYSCFGEISKGGQYGDEMDISYDYAEFLRFD